jgi:hypothetical protein
MIFPRSNPRTGRSSNRGFGTIWRLHWGRGGEEGVGEFREMVEAQRRTGGFLPEKNPLDPSPQGPTLEEKVLVLLNADDEQEPIFNLIVNMNQSFAHPALCPLTLGGWMFDIVADLTSTKPLVPAKESQWRDVLFETSRRRSHGSRREMSANPHVTPLQIPARPPGSIELGNLLNLLTPPWAREAQLEQTMNTQKKFDKS